MILMENYSADQVLRNVERRCGFLKHQHDVREGGEGKSLLQ